MSMFTPTGVDPTMKRVVTLDAASAYAIMHAMATVIELNKMLHREGGKSRLGDVREAEIREISGRFRSAWIDGPLADFVTIVPNDDLK
jgi:hypothetical protein